MRIEPKATINQGTQPHEYCRVDSKGVTFKDILSESNQGQSFFESYILEPLKWVWNWILNFFGLVEPIQSQEEKNLEHIQVLDRLINEFDALCANGQWADRFNDLDFHLREAILKEDKKVRGKTDRQLQIQFVRELQKYNTGAAGILEPRQEVPKYLQSVRANLKEAT